MKRASSAAAAAGNRKSGKSDIDSSFTTKIGAAVDVVTLRGPSALPAHLATLDEGNAFESFIFPLKPSAFLQDIYRKKCLVIHGGGMSRLEAMCDSDLCGESAVSSCGALPQSLVYVFQHNIASAFHMREMLLHPQRYRRELLP